MKAENLEAAFRVVTSLNALRRFRDVYQKSGGPYVTLEAGAAGAKMTLSPESRPAVLAALDVEEKALRNSLELLGVDPPAED